MAIQKKHGKGRLDKYYKLAKEKGYRARAAFKLIQLNKKYHFLEKSKVLIDLCAAPGSWCQVASEVMPPNSLIVGVDLAPIKAIPRCITFQSDITTDKCRATIRQHLKTWKADTVLHDGAPNVGTAWVQDAFTQAELVLQSLKLATEFLTPGGNFVTKIFRSKDYNSLLWVFNQLFGKVEATKPPSSRNVSAEIFVVCRDYKAPKRIDPRFLDPASVFAELAAPTPNNEARVFNPEVKKRKREGYEDGDWTQFKEAPVSEFIQTTDPIAMLGGHNRLSFEHRPNGDLALAALDRLPETTQEVRDCCKDLKVLGRKDFKLLLRWRLKVREQFGLSTKKQADETPGEEVVQVEDMDEDMQIQEEMQRLKEQVDSKKKKEKRKENERKQKEIVRMQMNMTTPLEIGIEQGSGQGEDSLFGVKSIDKAGKLSKIVSGKMHTVVPRVEPEEVSSDEEASEDEFEDNLEDQLDSLYDQYQEHRKEVDAKYRAKKARQKHKGGDDDEFVDFSDREVSSEEEVIEDEDDDDASSEDGENEESRALFPAAASTSTTDGSLSQRAAMFFAQDIFKNIPGLNDTTNDDSGIEMEDSSEQDESVKPSAKGKIIGKLSDGKAVSVIDSESSKSKSQKKPAKEDNDNIDGDFEVVRNTSPNAWVSDSFNDDPFTESGRPDIDIITAEAMTLAQALARGGKSAAAALTDDAFNKYSHRDTDGLPAWFLDDEAEHSRPLRPVTAAAAAAIKEKLRALNARPIKKVREAKARKKMRAAQRLEKLKKKSALLVEDDGMSERDKAKAVEKIMSKAGKGGKGKKDKVTVVVARKGGAGRTGRPSGVKGRYKMVDARMKKERRAEKRVAKKQKK